MMPSRRKKGKKKRGGKSQARFSQQNLALDKSKLSSIRQRVGKSSKRFDLTGLIPLDGDSPYAEYLPARFKQYMNQQALEEQILYEVEAEKSVVEYKAKMSDMHTVY